jgi:MFS family permease
LLCFISIIVIKLLIIKNLKGMETKTNFSEKESMAIIAEMIERARNNFRKGSGNSMIFWGCSAAFTSLLVFVLLKTLDKPVWAFWAWCLMGVCGVIDFFIKRKQEKNLLVKTHIDVILSTIWRGYVLFVWLFLAIVFAFGMATNDDNIFALITPVILLAVGMAEFVTAKTCRFKWYLYGAIVMWTGAVVCVGLTLLANSVDYQFIVLAVCMLVGFTVTGILQNKKSEKNV